jgi:hypothetical protein
VSYRLTMSAEIGDWLAEVCAAEPVAAAELGAALVLLAEATELPGPPLVADLTADQAAPEPAVGDPREAVDHAYQQLLDALQRVRREVAEVASDRSARRLSVRTFEDGRTAEQFSEPLPDEERAALAKREQELSARSQRLQQEVDAFRTAKETAKAMYTAAEASLRVHAAIAAAESSGDLAGRAATGTDPAAPQDDDEVAALNQALGAAEANLTAVLTQAKRTLRHIRDAGRPGGQRQPDYAPEDASEKAAAENGDAPVAGLLELRADPLGADFRVLFAIEPAGTATLLAVLDGADAISEHRDEAIALAGELLTEIRDGSWPPAETEGAGTGEICVADAATLLAKLFPDRGGAICARAAELADLRTPADLRRERELSIAEVADRAGLSEHRVWQIEHAGLRSVELQEAAAYLRALGGRLDMTVTFGPAGRTSLS